MLPDTIIIVLFLGHYGLLSSTRHIAAVVRLPIRQYSLLVKVVAYNSPRQGGFSSMRCARLYRVPSERL